jgi:hypothetical protein
MIVIQGQSYTVNSAAITISRTAVLGRVCSQATPTPDDEAMAARSLSQMIPGLPASICSYQQVQINGAWQILVTFNLDLDELLSIAEEISILWLEKKLSDLAASTPEEQSRVDALRVSLQEQLDKAKGAVTPNPLLTMLEGGATSTAKKIGDLLDLHPEGEAIDVAATSAPPAGFQPTEKRGRTKKVGAIAD